MIIAMSTIAGNTYSHLLYQIKVSTSVFWSFENAVCGKNNMYAQ